MKTSWVRHGVLLTAYALLFALGRATRLTDEGFALWWPAAGVAMIWGLSARSRRDLMVGVSLLVAVSTSGNLLTSVPLAQASAFGVANGCLGIGAWAGRRALQQHSSLHDAGRRLRVPGDLGALLIVVVCGSLASLPPMLVGVRISELSVSTDLVVGWLTRQLVGGTSVLAIFLTVAETRRTGARKEPARRAAGAPEALALVTVTVLVVLAVFGRDQILPLSFLVTPLVVWTGTRFAPPVAVAHALLTSCAIGAMYLIGAGGPVQAVPDPFRTTLVLQALSGVTLVLALALSLAVQEKSALLTSLRDAESRERSRADLLDTITASMVDGLVVADASRRIHVANDDARVMLGLVGDVLPSESVLGLSAVDGSPVPHHDGPLDRALRGERFAALDLRHVHPVTGERRVLTIGSAPVPDVTGRGPLAVLVVRDVTDRYRRLRQLEAFAGTVAHDLQNPLTAASGWTELVNERLREEKRGVNDRLSGPVARVSSSLARAQALVGDLLDYSTASTTAIRPDVVDVDDVVSAQAADVCMRYPDRRVHIEAKDLGHLRVDPGLFAQLVANLIGNAVKYVEPTTMPVVKIAMQRDPHGAKLSVSDNGSGIPDREKLHVFEAFHRAHPDTPGTGLGLAICAHVAERHGGGLSVSDGPSGTGSTFTLTLPAECLVDPRPAGTTTERRVARVPGSRDADHDADRLPSSALASQAEPHHVHLARTSTSRRSDSAVEGSGPVPRRGDAVTPP